MLHLAILLDQTEELSLLQRSQLFLECFGNVMIREKTRDYINAKAMELIRYLVRANRSVVTDSKGFLASLLDFSALKFRERDDIEFVFKFWRDEKRPWDGPALWDYRSRKYLGRRFDSRENIFDWDYSMKLLERDPAASIIHRQEYCKWRMHGNAHELRDSHYEHSNRTMATVDHLTQEGLKVNKWGLFHDILVGPFLSFSVDSEHKHLLKKANERHQYPCQHIAEVNVQSMVHELTTGCVFQDTQVAAIQEVPAEAPVVPLDRIKIHFLPCDPQETLVKKAAKWDQAFDRVFLSSALAHRLPETQRVLKPQGQVVVEGAQYMLDLSREQLAAYTEKVLQLAASAGLKCDAQPDRYGDFLVFTK
ncbi:Dynein assembly factor 3, axonemal [Kappamyces sp. JEL0829]|nr:Dynein assembly factor 3, axonemal [Kappamyces sp. JEL0829]